MIRCFTSRLVGPARLLPTLLCSLAACQSSPVAGDAPDSPVAAQTSALVTPEARPLAPLSGSIAGSRQPIFRWIGPPIAVLEICADRACTRPLQVFPGTNGTAHPLAPLPVGVVFWRLLASLENGRPVFAPVWELFVPPTGSAPAAIRGLRYDSDADGFADAAVNEQQEDQAVSRVHGSASRATR